MKITVDMVMEKDPYSNYDRSAVEKLLGENEHMTLMQISELNIPIVDRIWAITRFLDNKSNRLFAADCAERCLIGMTDAVMKNATSELIGMVRAYACGKITYEQLSAHRAAHREAYSAADGAAYSAAYSAADGAAYWVAYSAVDSAAYWVEEREWQLNKIREYIREVEE